MCATTYQYLATATSTLVSDTNDPAVFAQDIAQIQVNPTKLSRMLYLGLELTELKQKLTNTSLEDGAITGLLAILEHPVTDTYEKALGNVENNKPNPANQKLGTMQKGVEAFLHALAGINGNEKLGMEGVDWKKSADAIHLDIQRAIDSDLPCTQALSAVANPVNEFNDNVSITIGSGTDQAGKQTGIKDTK